MKPLDDGTGARRYGPGLMSKECVQVPIPWPEWLLANKKPTPRVPHCWPQAVLRSMTTEARR
jgi:hypothetical protein